MQGTMPASEAVVRSLIFVALAAVTATLAYLYQRSERQQRVASLWIWPTFFTLLAVRSVLAQLPLDAVLGSWLAMAFSLGLAVGVARGLTLKVTAASESNTLRIMATPASAAIYLTLLFFNEFLHAFRYGEPQMSRISCALLVLTAGSSIAVNTVRVLRYASIDKHV